MESQVLCRWCGEESVEKWLSYPCIGLGLLKCCSCGVTTSDATYEHIDYKEYNRTLTKLEESTAVDAETQVQRRKMEAGYLRQRVENICQDKLITGCKFLDVGCGPGDLVAELTETYPKSVIKGLDPSRYNIIEAKDKYGIDLDEGYWGDYNGEKFDVITFFGNLMLHPDPKDSLLKAYRLLNPAGILIFDVKNPENATRTAMVRLKNYLPEVSRINQFYWHAFHGMPWGLPRKALQSYLSNLGFKDLRVYSYPGRTAALNGQNGLVSRVAAIYDKLMGQQAWLEICAFK